MRTTLTTSTDRSNLTTRLRLGALRVAGVTVVAAGAITALGGPFVAEAGALPKPPSIDIDDLTVETIPPEAIPPTVPTTVKPPVLPPFDIDLDDITVETIPPETIPPTTEPPADDPSDEATPSTTVPPADDPDDLTTETLPPTTVAPTDPVEPEVEGTTAEQAAAEQLAYTGDSPLLPIVGASLLAAGGILAGGMAYDRRRRARG